VDSSCVGSSKSNGSILVTCLSEMHSAVTLLHRDILHQVHTRSKLGTLPLPLPYFQSSPGNDSMD
jgi:hypothetical protein